VTGRIRRARVIRTTPILRGLAARSPYFHAGAAENIQMLIHFYNARFQIGLFEDQVNDLGAFLEAQ
jgi:cytochrome c peroxidase